MRAKATPERRAGCGDAASIDGLEGPLYDLIRTRREPYHTCGGVSEWLKATVC
jgi:hypothetical protein